MDTQNIEDTTRLKQLEIMRVLAYGNLAGFFLVLVLLLFIELPESGHDALIQMLGALTISFGLLMGYFFGTSASSTNKDFKPVVSSPVPPVVGG